MKFNVEYVASDSMPCQGSLQDVRRKYGSEWIIKPCGGGNGNWLLLKNSDVLVNGKSCRDFVLEHYKKSKLTKSLAEKFSEELNNGRIQLGDAE